MVGMAEPREKPPDIWGGFEWHTGPTDRREPPGKPPPRAAHGTVMGTVRAWHAEEGWGVLTAPDGTEVWCHFSHVEMPGYRVLSPGQSVSFNYETPGQDGCAARVTSFVRPAE
jgi:CspA family cold shock protein